METNQILQGDCLEVLRGLPENSVDSVVTDPPYELGFMGKSWDSTGIAYNTELWKQVFRVLKPGGHLLSFGGSRTYHRMAVAIEDAGFEIRDQIMWVYGSGFPKSLNLGNGWGTALKPAHEPICLARKPLSEKTVAENVLKYRTGGINIDGSRITTDESLNQGASNLGYHGVQQARQTAQNLAGRFPANLIHDGSPEVLAEFPNTGMSVGGRSGHTAAYSGGYKQEFYGDQKPGFGDSGSAARFFYCAKASKQERGESNNHPTVKPLALMRYLIRLVTPSKGIVLDPFSGSGSTLVAAKELGFNFVGIEREQEYIEIARRRVAVAAQPFL